MNGGPVPAHGRLALCGTCGGIIAFVEVRGDGRKTDLEAANLTLGTTLHFASSPDCNAGGTFEGLDVMACRCRSPVRLQRRDGLFCAKCNGLIAPHLRSAEPPPAKEKPCRRR